MTKTLEALISSEIADFFAGVVDIHTELFGPNTIEEAQQKLTERVTRIARECEAATSNALLDAGKRIAELESAIIDHSNSVHFCEVCGKDDPCATDDVCSVIRAADGTVGGE